MLLLILTRIISQFCMNVELIEYESLIVRDSVIGTVIFFCYKKLTLKTFLAGCLNFRSSFRMRRAHTIAKKQDVIAIEN